MYVDKKIANAKSRSFKTFSRLNRARLPGKDQTFIIDFINDPDVVRAAAASMIGAPGSEVQDLNVIYDLKGFLDDPGAI